MDINILIPEKYFYFLEKFTRSQYKDAFRQYCSETARFFSDLDNGTYSAEAAAFGLIEHVEALLPRRFRRKIIFFDLKRLIFLYTVPAAIDHGSEQSIGFVDAMQKTWNIKYPEDLLNAAKFDEINGSFNNTIMGFKFGGDN